MKRLSLPAMALLLSAAAGSAQQPAGADARWQAFVGCWQPEGAGAAAVCVLPAGPNAVDVVTVVDNKVESRQRVDASGAQVPSTRDKCAGWDQARWSPDGKRLYLRSEHTCDGVAVRSTGVMSVIATGEWLDVRGVSLAGGPADVRARRYRELPAAVSLPAGLAAEVDAAASMARYAARANAAEPITTAAVVEASRELDARVVEAWLAERGEPFEIDAKRIAALADAGVPESVIDMVVAVSFPKKFAVNARAREAEPRPAAESVRPGPVAIIDPFMVGSYGRLGSCYDRIGLYGPLYSGRVPSYCQGYMPYGWGRAGLGYGYGYGYVPGTVIVIREPAGGGSGRSSGRMVKGRGYSSGSTDGDRKASPRSTESGTSRAGSATTSSSGTSSSSGRGSAGSTTSGSAGGERTAKPRNP